MKTLVSGFAVGLAVSIAAYLWFQDYLETALAERDQYWHTVITQKLDEVRTHHTRQLDQLRRECTSRIEEAERRGYRDGETDGLQKAEKRYQRILSEWTEQHEKQILRLEKDINAFGKLIKRIEHPPPKVRTASHTDRQIVTANDKQNDVPATAAASVNRKAKSARTDTTSMPAHPLQLTACVTGIVLLIILIPLLIMRSQQQSRRRRYRL